MTVVVARAVDRLLEGPSDGGWFMYAPNSGNMYAPSPPDGSILRTAGISIAGIVLWSAWAWWLCRRPTTE